MGLRGPCFPPLGRAPCPQRKHSGGFLEPLSHLVVTWAWEVLKALVAGEEESGCGGRQRGRRSRAHSCLALCKVSLCSARTVFSKRLSLKPR